MSKGYSLYAPCSTRNLGHVPFTTWRVTEEAHLRCIWAVRAAICASPHSLCTPQLAFKLFVLLCLVPHPLLLFFILFILQIPGCRGKMAVKVSHRLFLCRP